MFITAFAILAAFQSPAPASTPITPAAFVASATQNVVLVMMDGLRWQEVFRGADEAYMTKDVGKVEKPDPLKAKWLRPTAEERRKELMPFLWGTVVPAGQIYGNRDKGSAVAVTNGIGVSYPGYAETLCGFAQPEIKDNRKFPNPSPTVIEWITKQPGFEGRAVAFGAWDTFSFIFRKDTCGFPVDDGTVPFTQGRLTPEIEAVNRVRADTFYRWSGVAYDSYVVNLALPWIGANKPRVVFFGMGETDEWAHEYDYEKYLEAAHRCDGFVQRLWSQLQADEQYKGKTTMILCPDHGRGDLSTSPRAWGDHGKKYPGSEDIWFAIIGPDTPAMGERTNVPVVTQSQIAATLAKSLGLDYNEAEPRAGKPVDGVLK